MGDDSKGYIPDRRNSMGPGSTVQGGGTFSVNLWKRELGGGRGDAQVPDVIPPSCSATDHRDEGETWDRQRVVASSDRGGNGIRRAPLHRSIHKETADNHSGEGGMLSCWPVYELCTEAEIMP